MFLILILIISFLFYSPTLSYYFVSDDFISFSYGSDLNIINLLKINPNNNHYIPVFTIINQVWVKLFSHNPLPYHLFVILIHLINVLLVYQLSKLLIKNRVKNLITALIFSFFFSAYEVVYWYGANNNLLLVTFYLINLIWLIKYIKNNKPIHLILFNIGFILALFTHEYAISLIPVSIIYWWLFAHKKNWLSLIKLTLVPSLIFLITTLLKMSIVKMSLLVRTPSIIKSLAYMIRSFVYLFIPNPYIIDKIPNLITPFIFLIISYLIIKLTKNKQTLFLLIWTTITIVVYSITSAPQARYYYLSSIPVIIYILSIINFKKPLSKLISIIYLLFILISGIIFLQDQQYYWRLNSQITKNVIHDLRKYAKQIPNNSTLYFINLPDSSNDSIWKAYVFRAGFNDMINNFINIYPKRIIYRQSLTPSSHTMEAPYISIQELNKLKGKVLVFIYQEDKKTVVLMK